MIPQKSDRPYDLITFGDLCVDLVVSDDDVAPRFGQVEKLVADYHLEMGGSCSIFACQAAKLGLRVSILGRVGDDDFGRLVLRRLAECGVDTQHVLVVPQLKTGLSVALSQKGDRAILTYPGSLAALEASDVRDDFLASARHLHHGSFFLHTGLRSHMPDIFRRARSLGLSTSLDPNWDPAERWNSTLLETISLTDIFMPNDEEALRISRESDLTTAVTYFRDRVAMLALKRGDAGASLYANGESFDCQVDPVSGGDSIGAGDSFDAGFLAGWLRELPLQTCLELACRCGRGVAGAVGGLQGQPTWAELTT